MLISTGAARLVAVFHGTLRTLNADWPPVFYGVSAVDCIQLRFLPQMSQRASILTNTGFAKHCELIGEARVSSSSRQEREWAVLAEHHDQRPKNISKPS